MLHIIIIHSERRCNTMKCKANKDLLKGKKIKLYPTEEQAKKLDRYIQLYNYVYNWTLELEYRNYEQGNKFIRFIDACKLFGKFREATEWLKELPLTTSRQAIQDAINSFINFFSGNTDRPKFKSKRKSKKSFRSRAERLGVKGSGIRLEGFARKDLIEAKNHNLDENMRYYNPTVTFDGDSYWLSVTYERIPRKIENEQQDPIGIDVGIRNLITTSDNVVYRLPNVDKLTKRQKRQQRRVGRDYRKLLAESERTRTKYEDLPKSKNMLKRQAAVRKTIRKISNIYRNYIHNATREIVNRNPSAIVIEDISVNEMIAETPYLKKSKPQMRFYEIHRQLRYKAEEAGIPVIVADKFYPSTKRCNCCGNIKEITTQKTYVCHVCGYRNDRDLNAAYNLRDLAYNIQ